MTLETWLAFLIACWAISLSPGAGAVASMASGLDNGVRRAMWTVIGLQLGVLVHIALVAVGLGAVLATSRFAFEAIRWAGVVYLVYLGVQQIRTRSEAFAVQSSGTLRSRRALVARGLLVNVTNPKAIVFMLAVLPQFVEVGRPLASQYLTIAATMVAVDIMVMTGYSGLAARVLRLLKDPRQVRWINRLFGTLFIGAAAALATFRRAQ